MRTPRVALVATLLSLTLFAGCGGDDKKDSDSADDKSTDATSETTSASASPTETTPVETTPAETSTPPMPTEGDVTSEQLNAALLTPAEIAPDFALGTYTDEDSPPPCDPSGTPVDEVVPPQIQGGTEIDHVDGIAAVQEEIAVYETEALATQAFGLAVAGLACAEGSIAGSPFTIGPPQDVTAQVNTSGIGTSTAWEVSSEGFKGVIVATLASRLILATQFGATPDADTSALPSPVDIAAAAFAKALAN